MKKELTIKEARELFGSEKVLATDSGFIFNDFGKYRPNLTFVLDGEFYLDEHGEVMNPIQYVADREVTDSFNLDLDGEARVLFGDFWRSQKGGACFRPKDPREAKHILVKVEWGGSCKRTRGFSGNGTTERGATYFRRASSNGGGSGYDYWILPVGYVHQLGTQAYRIDWETAQDYCAKLSATSARQRAEAHRLYEEYLTAKANSRRDRATILPLLVRIDQQLEALRAYDANVDTLTLEEETFTLGYRQPMFYTHQNVAIAQQVLVDRTAEVERMRMAEQLKQQKWEKFSPHYASLQMRAEAVGMAIDVEDHAKATLYRAGEQILQKDYSLEGLEAFIARICAEEQELEAQRRLAEKLEAEAAAKAAGLPSDIRIWKRTGGRTGCSKGWVIGADGVERERDEIFNENPRRAERYDEGYEIWHQILPGELVIQWSKDCTAADHVCEIVHRPNTLTEAQVERIAEIQADIEEEWRGLTSLASKKESPSIGDGWFKVLI